MRQQGFLRQFRNAPGIPGQPPGVSRDSSYDAQNDDQTPKELNHRSTLLASPKINISLQLPRFIKLFN